MTDGDPYFGKGAPSPLAHAAVGQPLPLVPLARRRPSGSTVNGVQLLELGLGATLRQPCPQPVGSGAAPQGGSGRHVVPPPGGFQRLGVQFLHDPIVRQARTAQTGDTLDHDPACSPVPGRPLAGPHVLCDCGAVLAYWQVHCFDGEARP